MIATIIFRGVLSQGFLYVLNHKGETREGWPIQMGDIQAGAAVTELYG